VRPTRTTVGATSLEQFLVLCAAGKIPHVLESDDLAPVDQFHLGGKAATLELARLVDLRPGQRILEIGAGLGGPARLLARDFRCTVTVVDLTAEYCRVGALLTARTGPSGSVVVLAGPERDRTVSRGVSVTTGPNRACPSERPLGMTPIIGPPP
jgi:SAM-dependent methyltransferase